MVTSHPSACSDFATSLMRNDSGQKCWLTIRIFTTGDMAPSLGKQRMPRVTRPGERELFRLCASYGGEAIPQHHEKDVAHERGIDEPHVSRRGDEGNEGERENLIAKASEADERVHKHGIVQRREHETILGNDFRDQADLH